MTPLRQRMIEDMQLRGLAPHTQRAYLQLDFRQMDGGLRLAHTAGWWKMGVCRTHLLPTLSVAS